LYPADELDDSIEVWWDNYIIIENNWRGHWSLFLVCNDCTVASGVFTHYK
jgi:hypothetical protein